MRTLVTGAAGFIGSTLVDRLLSEGHDVVGVDNLSTGSSTNLEAAMAGRRRGTAGFTFLPVDIQAPEMAGIVMGVNPDVIFHLAAHVDLRASVDDPQFDARTNIVGTINLCEAARRAGVRRIVYAASGGSRYGIPSQLPVDESHALAPLSPYAVAKLAGELYLGAYAGMYDMAPICLALSNVYGPRQNPGGEAGVIAVFGGALLAGESVTVYGDGSAARDYVYVDDVVDAFVRAGTAPLSVAGTFNIGTGVCTSVTEVFGLISGLFEQVPPPRHTEARTGELQRISLDAGRARTELGWAPAVDIAAGIERTVRWLRGRQDVLRAS